MPALIFVNGKVSIGHVVGRLPRPPPARRRDAGDRDVRIGAGPHPGAGGDHLRLPRGGPHRLWLLAKVTEKPLTACSTRSRSTTATFHRSRSGPSTCATSSTTWRSPTSRCSRPSRDGGPPMALKTGSGRWSALWGAGMFAIFLGERMMSEREERRPGRRDDHRAAAGAGRDRHSRRPGPNRRARSPGPRTDLRGALQPEPVRGGALLCDSDLVTFAFGKPLEHNWPKLATALAALWPALWTVAAWPVVLVELAYAQIARAPRLELGRIRSAMMSPAWASPPRWCSRSRRLRRVGARREGRPRVLPATRARAR